jgi:SEC-C motif
MSEDSLPQHFAPQPARVDGVTNAERYLKKLCDKTFLSLWSHSGIYRDQGKPTTAADGKELCDLLVVFEQHIIIFSDKDCKFPTTNDLDIAWSRWFRRAVDESAKQIWGAERWIRERPDRLFLDRTCTRRFPIDLPPLDQVKFHRVVVAHNVSAACRAKLGGSGSLMLMPHIIGSMHTDNKAGVVPFAVGQLDPAKGYVHVLDDTSLDILLRTRDTITDFVDYLTKKELLIESGTLVSAAGEEDLLAFYLGRLNETNEHDFIVPKPYTNLVVEEGEWKRFSASPERISQVQADETSYLWDHLIEKFTYHFVNGTSEFCSNPTYADQERLFRLFAKESRYRRRMLANALLEAIDKGRQSDRLIRVSPPLQPGVPYYVFLTLKPTLSVFKTSEQYRQARLGLLQCVCQVVKLKWPDATDILGMALEPLDVPGGLRSEDAVYFDAREWTDEMAEEAKELQTKLKILLNVTEYRRSFQEYPEHSSPQPVTPQLVTIPTHREKQSLRNSSCPCGSGQKYKKCCMRR